MLTYIEKTSVSWMIHIVLYYTIQIKKTGANSVNIEWSYGTKEKNWCHHSESDSEDFAGSLASIFLRRFFSSTKNLWQEWIIRSSLGVNGFPDMIPRDFFLTTADFLPPSQATIAWWSCACASASHVSTWPVSVDRRRSVILLGVQSSYPWRAIWRRYGQI